MARWTDETRERHRKLIQNWKPWVLAAQSGKSGRPRLWKEAPAPEERVTYRALTNAVARFCQSDEVEA